jgi:hypothetical protein
MKCFGQGAVPRERSANPNILAMTFFKNPFVAADVSRRKRAGIGLNNASTDVGGYERVLESALRGSLP